MPFLFVGLDFDLLSGSRPLLFFFSAFAPETNQASFHNNQPLGLFPLRFAVSSASQSVSLFGGAWFAASTPPVHPLTRCACASQSRCCVKAGATWVFSERVQVVPRVFNKFASSLRRAVGRESQDNRGNFFLHEPANIVIPHGTVDMLAGGFFRRPGLPGLSPRVRWACQR